jgi:hypothetical protein
MIFDCSKLTSFTGMPSYENLLSDASFHETGSSYDVANYGTKENEADSYTDGGSEDLTLLDGHTYNKKENPDNAYRSYFQSTNPSWTQSDSNSSSQLGSTTAWIL